jgi:hypothetical protein
VLAQIHQEYPGDVRLVYRHFPLVDIHDKAQLAAEAAEAAGAQGKFWEMHELLYEKYTTWADLPSADRKLLYRYAEQIGLTRSSFPPTWTAASSRKCRTLSTRPSTFPPGTPFRCSTASLIKAAGALGVRRADQTGAAQRTPVCRRAPGHH